MTKTILKYVCQNCGSISHKWLGRCPDCDSWNTFIEEYLTEPSKTPKKQHNKSETFSLDKIISPDNIRYSTKIKEFDRVIGGGIILGSSVLIGGEPGIGKSTLALQIAGAMAKEGLKILYISGEESPHQLKTRAERLNIVSSNIFISSQTDFYDIESETINLNPSLIIIDSIQTISHSNIPAIMGSISQIKQCSTELIKIAKTKNIPILFIGHVTKDGAIAGPRLLEHMVDTVLYFEGDKKQQIRILRSFKNRFGSTNDIAIWEMGPFGLCDVNNISSVFIDKDSLNLPGSSLSVTLEGIRPFIIETQALVTPQKSSFPPRRNFTGVDYNRTAMIIAVLEKKGGLYLGTEDIFINIVGGVKINDPAIDLSLAAAICSSFKNSPLPKDSLFIGELGLSGELRAVNQAEKRINEAEKFGVNKIFMPKSSYDKIKTKFNVRINPVSSINELLSIIF